MRRNACISVSTSPQISESKPLAPASNVPTTSQSRLAKCTFSPMRVPSKPRAMAPPTMISADPGANRRPAASFTCGRNASPLREVPRMMTLEGFCAPLLRSEMSTISSLETSALPSAPSATARCVSSTLACSRVMPLWTSVSEPLRIATTLSYSPVVTSVCFSPASSISTVAKTNTTSASPPAVSTVVSRRVQRLRAT